VVIWLTGLSGVGKTVIGRRLCELWRRREPSTALVDGDDVRRLLGRDGEDAYTPAARRDVAERIAALCGWLDGQGFNVVCCTISAFPEILAANRARFSRYFEVFIDAPREVIERRAPSDLYGRARRGEIANVVGVDLPFSPPTAPNLVVQNGADAGDPSAIAGRILDKALAA